MHILCSKAFVDANFNVNSIANGDLTKSINKMAVLFAYQRLTADE